MTRLQLILIIKGGIILISRWLTLLIMVSLLIGVRVRWRRIRMKAIILVYIRMDTDIQVTLLRTFIILTSDHTLIHKATTCPLTQTQTTDIHMALNLTLPTLITLITMFPKVIVQHQVATRPHIPLSTQEDNRLILDLPL